MNTTTRADAVHWSTQGERGSLALTRLMAWIAITFGRRIARCLLPPIALYFLLMSPAARRRSLRYLSRAHGRPARWPDAYRHIHAFASVILDRVYLARGQLHLFDIDMSGYALMDQLVDEGRGAILVGAHMGSFEVLHAIGTTRPALRVAMAMYPDNARKIHGVLQAIAPGSHLDIIAIGSGASTLAIRDWLAGGGLTGILADRHMPGESRRDALVRLPFLGHDAVFSDGPWRLAQVLRQRVVFMCGLYQGGNRYALRFEALADFSQRAGSAADADKALREAMQAYVARLEALCREAPTNWFNFHDFWDEDGAA